MTSTDQQLSAVRFAISRTPDTGWWGDRKVYIAAIWAQLRASSEDRWFGTRAQFVAWLLAANRAGLLELARADLVSAMDSALVADSEIHSESTAWTGAGLDTVRAEYHFVVATR